MEPQRPDPSVLLKRIEKTEQKKGKLKIFFGACAGVGKTYTMLTAALEKIKEGEKVLAGVIETHGRTECIKLMADIPSLPQKTLEYHGITLHDLDLDQAIKAHPDILLVDELAHTNPPNMRHPKRWQDIQEILEAGIDVYTTLNVQHIESLNDVVADLTGIRVKETVPDVIFDAADEIELIDVPSEVILERLKEGKVYLGEFAKQRAMENFFKIENLIALREVALRRTAERVDALSALYKKSSADKILVCIGPTMLATKIIRSAKQLATKLKTVWTTLYIENLQHYNLSEDEKMQIERNLQLAERLGAKTHVIQDTQTAQAIIQYAKENNVTKLILGKPTKPFWKRKLFGSLISQIIDQRSPFDIYIIGENITVAPKTPRKSFLPWKSYLIAVLIIILCTGISFLLEEISRPEDLIMIYLIGIVIVSANYARSAAVFSGIFSVVCYHFCFTRSLNTPQTFHIHDFITLCFFLVTAIAISTLTSKLRLQKIHARLREKHSTQLYHFSKKLISAKGMSQIANVVVQQMNEIFQCVTTLWLPDEAGNLQLFSPARFKTDLKEESTAHWAYTHNQTAGVGTNTMPSARGYYLPLSNEQAVLGILGIMPNQGHALTSEEKMMLNALVIQLLLALQRVKNR